MSFAVRPEAYDRFMGRWSVPLAPELATFAAVGPGQRALDVGCGPGALTTELVRRVGADNVAAVDPAPGFVAAARGRHPGVRVEEAAAEELPFPDASFDVTLAQLVVHFMRDPVAGLREMARVTRAGGTVAACVWDHAGGTGPLGPFWDVVRGVDPDAPDESGLAGARAGHLTELFGAAGLGAVEEAPLSVTVEHESFDGWWEPFLAGVGPAGAYVAALDDDAREQIREQCRARLPDGAFALVASAWAARARA